MGTTFRATAAADFFADVGHVDRVDWDGTTYWPSTGDFDTDYNNPITADQMDSIVLSYGEGYYNFIVRNNDAVDYSFSNAAVHIDLSPQQPEIDFETIVQHGGFAEGDELLEISEVIGSFFNDIIRGSNRIPDRPPIVVNGANTTDATFFINNPGDNVLVGGNGSDILEGRGGADVLIGGSFSADFSFDFASYESSPAAVTVRLAGVGSDTQTAIATGGDAQGDTLVGIEGLIGSKFNDTLTGNSLNNVLVGFDGTNILDGKAGIDTVDYSNRQLDFLLGNNTSAFSVAVSLWPQRRPRNRQGVPDRSGKPDCGRYADQYRKCGRRLWRRHYHRQRASQCTRWILWRRRARRRARQ